MLNFEYHVEFVIFFSTPSSKLRKSFIGQSFFKEISLLIYVNVNKQNHFCEEKKIWTFRFRVVGQDINAKIDLLKLFSSKIHTTKFGNELPLIYLECLNPEHKNVNAISNRIWPHIVACNYYHTALNKRMLKILPLSRPFSLILITEPRSA